MDAYPGIILVASRAEIPKNQFSRVSPAYLDVLLKWKGWTGVDPIPAEQLCKYRPAGAQQRYYYAAISLVIAASMAGIRTPTDGADRRERLREIAYQELMKKMGLIVARTMIRLNWPDTVTATQLRLEVPELRDRWYDGAIAPLLDTVGYMLDMNPFEKRGRWLVNGKQVIRYRKDPRVWR